jgi:hypothetical protein
MHTCVTIESATTFRAQCACVCVCAFVCVCAYDYACLCVCVCVCVWHVCHKVSLSDDEKLIYYRPLRTYELCTVCVLWGQCIKLHTVLSGVCVNA